MSGALFQNAVLALILLNSIVLGIQGGKDTLIHGMTVTMSHSPVLYIL